MADSRDVNVNGRGIKNPPLFHNKSNSLFKDTLKKMDIWKTIGGILGINGEKYSATCVAANKITSDNVRQSNAS